MSPDRVTFTDQPEIEFPKALRDRGFLDDAWHNDASAKASIRLHEDDRVLVVWCAQADPQQREIPGAPKFSVVIYDEDFEVWEERGEFNTETSMLAVIDQILAADVGEAAPETGSLESLMCDLLQRYCEGEKLKCMSADDMLASLELTDAQRKWLTAYGELWDATDFEPPPVHLADDERREPNERPVSPQTGFED